MYHSRYQEVQRDSLESCRRDLYPQGQINIIKFLSPVPQLCTTINNQIVHRTFMHTYYYFALDQHLLYNTNLRNEVNKFT